jgi:hypothetical protein
MSCMKRQKVVKKGVEIHRCINSASAHHGGQVNEDICAACPVKVLRRERPCKKKHKEPKVPPPISDDKTMEVLNKDFGMDISEKQLKDYPSLYIQIMNYKEAVSRWLKAGKPTRTKQQMEQIVEAHCKKCDWYDKKAKRCKGCGCRISNSSIAIANKVKMATEHCPKGLW